jgi:hypothetical protein
MHVFLVSNSMSYKECLVPRRFGLFTSLSARGIDQIDPRGSRKGHASHRTTHSAWVRGRYKGEIDIGIRLHSRTWTTFFFPTALLSCF